MLVKFNFLNKSIKDDDLTPLLINNNMHNIREYKMKKFILKLLMPWINGLQDREIHIKT